MNICHNAYKWRADTFAKDDDGALEQGDLSKLKISKSLLRKGDGDGDSRQTGNYKLDYQAPFARLKCSVEVDYSAREELRADTEIRVSFENGGSTITKLTPFSFYLADTQIAELALPSPAKPNPAKSDRGATVKRNYSTYGDALMNGCTLRSFANLKESDCQSKCSEDPLCLAYSHNKISSACQLKHTINAMRLDPRWNSGAPVSTLSPGRSIREILMTGVFLADGQRLAGSSIATEKISDDDSDQRCQDLCQNDDACVAAEYDIGTQQCLRLSSVDGTRSDDDRQISSFIKIQGDRRRF